MAVEDQGRDRNPDAEEGVVERDGNAVRERPRVAAARRVLGTEDLDHPDDRAEKTQQRRDGGDGSERGEEPVELEPHGPARVLDRILEDLAGAALVEERRGENPADERPLLQAPDQVRRDPLRLVLADGGRQDVPGGYQGGAKRPETLPDDGEGDDGRDDDEPDRPTGRFDDGQHLRGVLRWERRWHFSPRAGVPQGLEAPRKNCHSACRNRETRVSPRNTAQMWRIIHRGCG